MSGANAEKKSFTCHVCRKGYSSAGNLKIHHRRVHLGERPFECDTCQKAFSAKYDLAVHRRLVHGGEKIVRERNFACALCRKEFPQYCNLKVHLRVHTGEKPYECEVCRGKFSQRSNLETHVARWHSGRHECGACLKAIPGRGGDLEAHACHDIGKSFACGVCKKKFTCRKSFENRKGKSECCAGRNFKADPAPIVFNVGLTRPVSRTESQSPAVNLFKKLKQEP